MKTIVIEGNRIDTPDDNLSWYFIPDSALANAGKPFFIPDFSDEFEAMLAPVVRISRLGKSIEARFAGRYYHEIAPAVHFRAPALRKSLIESHRPTDMSHSFDRSVIIGSFSGIDCPGGALPSYRLMKNGAEATVWRQSDFIRSVDQAIETVSTANTFKTGDLIIAGLSAPTPISLGDRLEVECDDKTLLWIAIR